MRVGYEDEGCRHGPVTIEFTKPLGTLEVVACTLQKFGPAVVRPVETKAAWWTGQRRPAIGS